jgi:branched-subunit amino acid aminotransferase/4-amino-4-deoxychorismate lyase
MKNNYLSIDSIIKTEDMGFLYGFSLFETFLINNRSKVFLIEKHIQRLQNSLRFFKIKLSYTDDDFINLIYNYINDNKLSDIILRITISAGNEQKNISPGIHFSIRSNPYSKEVIDLGCMLQISEVRKSESSILLRHKTSNYLENYYLLQNAKNNGFDDSIILNSVSHITETTKCNLFFIKDNILYTPDIKAGVLPGIIRNWVIEKANQKKISCFEGFYTKEDLFLADEIFITNSAIGIMYVKKIEEKLINIGQAGELTSLFKKEYDEISFL